MEQAVKVWRLVSEAPIRLRCVVAWFDCWVGLYVDRKAPALYIFPVPMLGIKIDWPTFKTSERETHGNQNPPLHHK